MIIYEFTTWGTHALFKVQEIEVEEKPKTYVSILTRIPKNNIGVLHNAYGDRMYLLENNPKIYIEAMINYKKGQIARLEDRISCEKNNLEKWEIAQRGIEEKNNE